MNWMRNKEGDGKKLLELLKLSCNNPNLNGIAARTASRKFDNGPARDTSIKPAEERLDMAYGFTGTGFAHPKPANTSIKEPMISR